jgi:hypothetical protein
MDEVLLTVHDKLLVDDQLSFDRSVERNRFGREFAVAIMDQLAMVYNPDEFDGFKIVGIRGADPLGF